MNFQPNDLIEAAHKASSAATKAVKAYADHEMIKEYSNNVLAKIMSEIKGTVEVKISEAELERRARCTDDWNEFTEHWKNVVHHYILTKIEASNAQREFDAIQSGMSYKKEEMRHVHGAP